MVTGSYSHGIWERVAAPGRTAKLMGLSWAPEVKPVSPGPLFFFKKVLRILQACVELPEDTPVGYSVAALEKEVPPPDLRKPLLDPQPEGAFSFSCVSVHTWPPQKAIAVKSKGEPTGIESDLRTDLKAVLSEPSSEGGACDREGTRA